MAPSKTRDRTGTEARPAAETRTNEAALTQNQREFLDDLDATIKAAVKPDFDQVRTGLSELGTRMDGLDGRMDGLDGRMDGLGTRMDGLSTHMSTLETQNATILKTLAKIEKKLG